MVSLQSCSTISSTLNHLSTPQKLRIVSVNRPTSYLKKPTIVLHKLPNLDLTKNVMVEDFNGVKSIPMREFSPKDLRKEQNDEVKVKLYAILETISDRIEMHNNVKEQRENWNSLMLNSINMITLTAATMVGVSGLGEESLPLKLSSMVMFGAATGLVLIMNKIQPSQLAQEQRNSVRLFKQLHTKVQTMISLRNYKQKDVEECIEKMLALDRAYPLPLLGAMLEKLPKTFKPAVWWPSMRKSSSFGRGSVSGKGNNGWSNELEEEMRDIVEVIEKKDKEDYARLGNKALKFNKMLAVSGPMLMGIAAIGSGFATSGSQWGGVVAAVAGSLAGVVNTIEHGGQVGMVFEMYRNCAGFFDHFEETIETNLEEQDLGRRENGELFEMKMALKLGRSLSELRDLAKKSSENGGFVNEFASKLF